MKLSDFVKELQEIQRRSDNDPIVVQAGDEEGNYFNEVGFVDQNDEDNRFVLLWPGDEYIDLNEYDK